MVISLIENNYENLPNQVVPNHEILGPGSWTKCSNIFTHYHNTNITYSLNLYTATITPENMQASTSDCFKRNYCNQTHCSILFPSPLLQRMTRPNEQLLSSNFPSRWGAVIATFHEARGVSLLVCTSIFSGLPLTLTYLFIYLFVLHVSGQYWPFAFISNK